MAAVVLAVAGVAFSPNLSWAGVSADLVLPSTNLGGETTFNNTAAALGLPPRAGGVGALTPFNPNFGSDNIVRILPGGNLSVRLSAPVAVTGGATLGVISNIGISDGAGGTGQAGSPAAPFSAFPIANVEISSDGVSFVPVTTAPHTFDMPANGYVDTPSPWTDYTAQPGTVASDFGIAPPQAVLDGGFAQFDGKTYAQIAGSFAGSGGGDWFDVSGTGLSAFQFVRLSVPAGLDPSTSRMIVDAIVAVPEPASLSVLGLAAAAVLFRRRRRQG